MPGHPPRLMPIRAWCVLAAFLLASLTAKGAIFVHIPNVAGDVHVEGYDDGTWFEARSGSYGTDRTLPTSGEAGGTEDINIGVGDLSPLGIACDLNRATAPLLQASINGNSIGDIEIHLVDPGPVTFCVIRLKRAFVKSFEFHTPTDGGRPWFQAFLIYNKIEVTNRFGLASGTREQTTTWDLTHFTGSYSDQAAANQPPRITAIPNQVTNEDSSIVVPIPVSDPDGPDTALTLTATSFNTALLPATGVTLGGSGSNRMLTLKPAPNASGNAVVSVTVKDQEASASTNFLLSVLPVPDPPSIPPIPAQVTPLDTPLSLAIIPSDPDSSPQDIVVEASSGNPWLLPDYGLSLSHEPWGWMLTIWPAPGQSGSGDISLTVRDESGQQSSTSFTVTVNGPDNSAPTDILLEPAATVPENSLPGTLVGSLRAIDPDDDSGIEFTLVDDSSGRFTYGGSGLLYVGSGAALDYESSTQHEIRVQARDPEGAVFEKSLTIEVTNVNDPPIIHLEAPPTLPNSPFSGPRPVPLPYSILDITDPDSGSGDVTVELRVIYGALRLDDSGILAGRVANNGTSDISLYGATLDELRLVLLSGGLSYLPLPGYDGLEELTVQANDNGHSGSGNPEQAYASVAFRVATSPAWDWLYLYFSPEEIDNPSVGGLFADFDGDGLDAILEYKLARNPKNASDGASGIELHKVSFDSQPYWELSFIQRSDAATPDTQLTVEVSTDLDEWQTGAGIVERISATPTSGDLERVVYRLSRSADAEPRQFIRLRASYVGPF